MDVINDFIRNILWGLANGVLELLYGVNNNLIIPASNFNFTSTQFLLNISKNLVVPTMITYIIAVSIYSFFKQGFNKKEGAIYNLIKGIIVSTIISSTFYYIAPWFYQKTIELSIPLAETIGGDLKKIEQNDDMHTYYRDTNGEIIRYTDGKYYYSSTNYTVEEIQLTFFKTVVFYRDNKKSYGENVREHQLFEGTLKDYLATLTLAQDVNYNFDYNVLDTLIFETVVKVANVNMPKAEKFMHDYQSAKINKLDFDYNAKTKGATWFSSGVYHYEIRELYTCVVALITLIALMFIALGFLSRSLLYSYDMLLLPYSSVGLINDNKDSFDYIIKEMLGILALNIIQLWSFYFCMIFVQFTSATNAHPLFGFLALVSGLIFVSRVPSKILSVFKVQHQGLQNSSFIMFQFGMASFRAAGSLISAGFGAASKGINALNGAINSEKSTGNNIYSSNNIGGSSIDGSSQTTMTSSNNDAFSNVQNNDLSSTESGYSSFNSANTGLSDNSTSPTQNSDSYNNNFSSISNDMNTDSYNNTTNDFTQNDNFYDSMKDFDDYFDFRNGDDLNE